MRGHLDRVKAILIALLPVAQAPSVVADEYPIDDDRTTDGLGDRLTRSLQVDRDRHINDCFAAIASPDRSNVANIRSDSALDQPLNSTPIDLTIVNDYLELSVDEDREIWEDWLEATDVVTAANLTQPTIALPELDIPDFSDRWVRRPIDLVDLKPLVLRQTSETVTAVERWAKFEPEYVDFDPTIPTDRSPKT